MRGVRWAAVAWLLLSLLSLPVRAEEAAPTPEETYTAAVTELTRYLPSSVQEILEEWEVQELTPEAYSSVTFPHTLELAGELLSRQSRRAAGPLSALLGAAAAGALFGSAEGIGLGKGLGDTYRTVTVLAAGTGVLLPLSALMSLVGETVDRVAVFLTGFVPLYGAIVAAGGGAAQAVSYQTVLLGASQVLVWTVRQAVFPLLTVSLALGCTGSVTEGFPLDRAGDAVHKAVLWALGLFSTLFSGVLSMQQMASAAGDSLHSRALKFSLSSCVPVVGGLLSEAYATVVGCAGALRTAIGGFGLLCTVLILAAPLAECVCWLAALWIGETASALFGLPPLEKLCRTVSGTVKALIAVLAVFALLMAVSTAAVVYVGRTV